MVPRFRGISVEMEERESGYEFTFTDSGYKVKDAGVNDVTSVAMAVATMRLLTPGAGDGLRGEEVWLFAKTWDFKHYRQTARRPISKFKLRRSPIQA